MKIAFQNRQRRVSLDLDKVRKDFEILTEALADNLRSRAPAWLGADSVGHIFDSPLASLSVAIVSNRAIRILNRDWRGIDKATDVLSFPLDLDGDCLTPRSDQGFDPAFDQGSDQDCDEDSGKNFMEDWQIGDVIISAEKALSQAEDYGHSLERELAFLFVHGFLHVLGFDHITKKDELEMFGRQNEILSGAGFKR